MAVPIFLRRLRLCKMHMSAVPNVDCAAGAPLEFVEVALVEIGAEAYLMHVVSVAQRDGLAAYRCKAVIMRVGTRLRNLHAAHNLMDVTLRLAATAAHTAEISI